jgi:hypothetical protein
MNLAVLLLTFKKKESVVLSTSIIRKGVVPSFSLDE